MMHAQTQLPTASRKRFSESLLIHQIHLLWMIRELSTWGNVPIVFPSSCTSALKMHSGKLCAYA